MRIAYLTGEYPRATDTFIQREVLALRQKGIEVFTFSIRRTGIEHLVGEEQKAEQQSTFYILPPNPVTLITSHISLLLRSPLRYGQAFKLACSIRQHGIKGNLYQLFYFLEAGIVARQMQHLQIQHLHNHSADSSGTVAMLAAKMAGATFSMTLHGPGIFFEPYRWRLDEKIKRALFVICISCFCRSQAMIFAPLEKWKQMHIIHCGIAPNLFKLTFHERDRKNLLYLGRLVAVKGLPILLESLAILKVKHPEMVLTVIGDGSERAELESLAQELELSEQVKFVGYKSQAEVREYLEQTDVFVLPSFAEGLPVSLMEAMAAGVPVVTSQIAGVSELVDNGINGYLVPPGDVKSLSEKIDVLLKDPLMRSQFGIQGRAKVEQDFNIDLEVDRLYGVFNAALQGKVEIITRINKSKRI